MKTFEVKVEKVNGYCSCAYKQGDAFIFHGYRTPADFCGGAYTTLFPIIVALHSGQHSHLKTIRTVKRKWLALIMEISYLMSH